MVEVAGVTRMTNRVVLLAVSVVLKTRKVIERNASTRYLHDSVTKLVRKWLLNKSVGMRRENHHHLKITRMSSMKMLLQVDNTMVRLLYLYNIVI